MVGITEQKIIKYRKGNTEECVDPIILESPLEMRIKQQRGIQLIHQRLAVTMCTPGQEEDLIRGFLFTEGIVQSADQILSISKLEESLFEAELTPEADFNLKQLDRNFFVNSSCGVCGKASKENIETEGPYLSWSSKFTIDSSVLFGLPAMLKATQSLFDQTGGVHAAALVNSNGEILVLREDVGRHNAVDKVIGAAMVMEQLPFENYLILVSGRASFELVQKAGMAGIPMLCAVGAPSSLAIASAKDQGMSLVGFLKPDGYNIYTGTQRIV